MTSYPNPLFTKIVDLNSQEYIDFRSRTEINSIYNYYTSVSDCKSECSTI